MAAALIEDLRPTIGTPHPVGAVELIPGGKGMYEISVDGRLVYSKLETGAHIADAEAIKLIRAAM